MQSGIRKIKSVNSKRGHLKLPSKKEEEKGKIMKRE
jgi:hypothetical protein